MYRYFNYVSYLTLSLILITISVIGDQFLQIKRSLFNNYLIAFCDNQIHGIIGAISWLMICICSGESIAEYSVLLQSIVCGVTASAIDLDHVIAAQSFHLKLIYQLESRPFLHNTSLTLLISLIILIIGLLSRNWMFYTFSWIFLTASLTHHLRDALRHGFWIYPFNTRPVPFWIYVLALTSYPLLCSCIMDFVTKKLLQTHSFTGQVKYQNVITEEV